MDPKEVRHVALGAAIDIWGDGDINLHGLLHLASQLEDYLNYGYVDNRAKVANPASAAPADPAPVVSADPKA